MERIENTREILWPMAMYGYLLSYINLMDAKKRMCSVELTDSLYLHKYNTINSLFLEKHW